MNDRKSRPASEYVHDLRRLAAATTGSEARLLQAVPSARTVTPVDRTRWFDGRTEMVGVVADDDACERTGR